MRSSFFFSCWHTIKKFWHVDDRLTHNTTWNFVQISYIVLYYYCKVSLHNVYFQLGDCPKGRARIYYLTRKYSSDCNELLQKWPAKQWSHLLKKFDIILLFPDRVPFVWNSMSIYVVIYLSCQHWHGFLMSTTCQHNCMSMTSLFSYLKNVKWGKASRHLLMQISVFLLHMKAAHQKEGGLCRSYMCFISFLL